MIRAAFIVARDSRRRVRQLRSFISQRCVRYLRLASDLSFGDASGVSHVGIMRETG